MSANVVPLFPELEIQKPKRRKALIPKTTPVFDEAWSAYPPSGRARQSRMEAFPIWSEIASEVGEDLLLACVKRYASEDKDAKSECGAPGFERWLKWGRWDNWRPTDPESELHTGKVFSDTTIRQACLARHGDAWCVSYLDRCTLIDGVIVTNSPTVFAKIGREGVFRELGVLVELRS